jgi:hypothetical protein
MDVHVERDLPRWQITGFLRVAGLFGARRLIALRSPFACNRAIVRSVRAVVRIRCQAYPHGLSLEHAASDNTEKSLTHRGMEEPCSHRR